MNKQFCVKRCNNFITNFSEILFDTIDFRRDPFFLHPTGTIVDEDSTEGGGRIAKLYPILLAIHNTGVVLKGRLALFLEKDIKTVAVQLVLKRTFE